MARKTLPAGFSPACKWQEPASSRSTLTNQQELYYCPGMIYGQVTQQTLICYLHTHHAMEPVIMELDPFLLARIQFAANISFHILFPTITIGLAWILLFFRIQYTRTGDMAWEYAYFFWVKVFALSFALGVVSGITMSFQFGTNWPGFMERAGNIA
ncbi:MAG TPA: cytochrome ubiquinol oxidase subunit I, partial [Pseudomonadales bacterium]